ncbi:MAG: response regulator, partial [Nitrospinaceae bacterium]|nr:response regulator [Nitrospinaceae bacterium]NIR54754.1 response regulator [Nitrospinaceae bacterium]NIS85179.1 response regulator [Nitrospinaceae bacterium]NIT81990.1 response regulator [Nitrospinaceae bacterium]NIU44253.1 response regulator [Nitrospinaceae bacterium]
DPVATENKPDHRQKSILIVEDDPASQNILSRLLKNKGYPIVTANNGNEAMIATEKEKPRLALVDVVMPEVSGMAFLRWLRERH